MLPMLLDSALRSLILGLVVWALLKMARLRDTRTETAIWTAVLIAALSMPLLSRYTPPMLLTVPHLSAASPESATALRLLAAQQALPPNGGEPSRRALEWLSHYGQTCILAAYAIGYFVCLTRIGVGLLLTLGLYRRAVPVNADWARGRNIRASTELKSPVSLAGAILLTADYSEWGASKRAAVLAHEEAHIARGDFFIQLAASIHCAFFWFSPFAWWLQSKLAEIAETASDEAAILRLEDRAVYAEILVEVSRSAHETRAIIAMAKGPFIQKRVEHILSETPTRNLSLPLRVLTITVLAVIALAVAGARAAVSPTANAAKAPAKSAAAKRSLQPSAKTPAGAMPATNAMPAVPIGHPAQQVAAIPHPAGSQDDEVTYNPRALLDPVYTPKPGHVPASTIVHAGREFYIRSSERPVADVSVTYATDRRTH